MFGILVLSFIERVTRRLFWHSKSNIVVWIQVIINRKRLGCLFVSRKKYEIDVCFRFRVFSENRWFLYGPTGVTTGIPAVGKLVLGGATSRPENPERLARLRDTRSNPSLEILRASAKTIRLCRLYLVVLLTSCTRWRPSVSEFNWIVVAAYLHINVLFLCRLEFREHCRCPRALLYLLVLRNCLRSKTDSPTRKAYDIISAKPSLLLYPSAESSLHRDRTKKCAPTVGHSMKLKPFSV